MADVVGFEVSSGRREDAFIHGWITTQPIVAVVCRSGIHVVDSTYFMLMTRKDHLYLEGAFQTWFPICLREQSIVSRVRQQWNQYVSINGSQRGGKRRLLRSTPLAMVSSTHCCLMQWCSPSMMPKSGRWLERAA